MRNDVTKHSLLIERKLNFDIATQIACLVEVADKEIPRLPTENNQAISNTSNSTGTM